MLAISAATVFLLTRQPASRRSAVIRGDPSLALVRREQPGDLGFEPVPARRAAAERSPPFHL